MDLFSTATKLEQRLVLHATRECIPLGGSFELLPLCNMDCRMCYLRLTPEQMRAQGRVRTAQEWLQLAKEARDAGLLFLLLTGGEPFLYPEFAALYRGLGQLGLYLTLNTNGTLITEEMADLLAEQLPRRVNITLYGSSDAVYDRLCGNPDGFSQVMDGIARLKKRRVPIKLNGSLTPENREDLENMQQIARKLELPLQVDSYMYPASRKGMCSFDPASRLTPEEAADGYVRIRGAELSEKEFLELAQAMAECYHNGKDAPWEGTAEKIPCRAGRSSFWINWKGNMTPCVFLEQPGIPVFETGFAASWEYIRREQEKMTMPPACSRCGKRAFCTVCGASVYTETGGCSEAPEYVCRMTTEKLRRMAEIADRARE